MASLAALFPFLTNRARKERVRIVHASAPHAIMKANEKKQKKFWYEKIEDHYRERIMTPKEKRVVGRQGMLVRHPNLFGRFVEFIELHTPYIDNKKNYFDPYAKLKGWIENGSGVSTDGGILPPNLYELEDNRSANFNRVRLGRVARILKKKMEQRQRDFKLSSILGEENKAEAEYQRAQALYYRHDAQYKLLKNIIAVTNNNEHIERSPIMQFIMGNLRTKVWQDRAPGLFTVSAVVAGLAFTMNVSEIETAANAKAMTLQQLSDMTAANNSKIQLHLADARDAIDTINQIGYSSAQGAADGMRFSNNRFIALTSVVDGIGLLYQNPPDLIGSGNLSKIPARIQAGNMFARVFSESKGDLNAVSTSGYMGILQSYGTYPIVALNHYDVLSQVRKPNGSLLLGSLSGDLKQTLEYSKINIAKTYSGLPGWNRNGLSATMQNVFGRAPDVMRDRLRNAFNGDNGAPLSVIVASMVDNQTPVPNEISDTFGIDAGFHFAHRDGPAVMNVVAEALKKSKDCTLQGSLSDVEPVGTTYYKFMTAQKEKSGVKEKSIAAKNPSGWYVSIDDQRLITACSAARRAYGIYKSEKPLGKGMPSPLDLNRAVVVAYDLHSQGLLDFQEGPNGTVEPLFKGRLAKDLADEAKEQATLAPEAVSTAQLTSASLALDAPKPN